jgi:RNA polymerase sigma factor (sigma-70 family)
MGLDAQAAFRSMPPPESELGRWFAAHVQPHEPMLRAWLRSRFKSETDLDDVVQETYLRLLRARERGEVTSPKAFLFAVARNLALDRFRHREVVPTESLAESEGLAVMDEGGSTPDLIAHHQELALLTEAIQSLPDRCRQIFTLRKVYGLAQSEIAAQLGVSENTVSAQLTIGVKKCMAFMLRCRREREGRWP